MSRVLRPFIALLLDKSLSTGSFPAELKEAVVCPMLKKGTWYWWTCGQFPTYYSSLSYRIGWYMHDYRHIDAVPLSQVSHHWNCGDEGFQQLVVGSGQMSAVSLWSNSSFRHGWPWCLAAPSWAPVRSGWHSTLFLFFQHDFTVMCSDATLFAVCLVCSARRAQFLARLSSSYIQLTLQLWLLSVNLHTYTDDMQLYLISAVMT